MWDEKKPQFIYLKKIDAFFQKFQNIATNYSSFFLHFHKISHPKKKNPGPIVAFES